MRYGTLSAYVLLIRSNFFMSLVPNTSESSIQDREPSENRSFLSSLLHLPRNVYLLLIFTTGKGFQLSMKAVTCNYYVGRLDYYPAVIGLFNDLHALGALFEPVPVGRLAA